jgi:nitrite reductase/ring-hydroxylating ferredoxin subunit
MSNNNEAGAPMEPLAETTSVAPCPWQPLNGVQAGQARYPVRVKLEGESIVLFKTKSGYRGVERLCPHMQASMMDAELTANDTMVRCPLHVFTFKLSDGKGVNCPGFKLNVYEIKEEDGQFFGRLAN